MSATATKQNRNWEKRKMEKGHSLPAELFRDIIQYTVQSQTFKHIVALRLVSSETPARFPVAKESKFY